MPQLSSRWVYNSRKWKTLRREQLFREPFCRWCTKASHKRVIASVVDHVVRIEAGGDPFPGPDGLMSLCVECHNAKSAAERRGSSIEAAEKRPRKRAYGIDGYPLDDS